MAQEETFQCKQETQTVKFIFYRKKDVYMNKLHNKKHRRLISLALALVMMFSFMAMSASAATVEVPVVQPRASTCPSCGNPSYESYWSGYDTANYWKYPSAGDKFQDSGMAAYHTHYKVAYISKIRCATCGRAETYTSSAYIVYCPYGG